MKSLFRTRLAVPLLGAFTLTCFLLFTLFQTEDIASWTSSLRLRPSDGGLLVPLSPEEHRYRNATTIHLNWTVTSGWRYPDGVRKRVYLVNDEFPCPNIEARVGDTIVIDVQNQLEDEGLALHFHGLRMEGANHMDGVVGITQKPIPQGESFTYTIPLISQQPGTFWWHAHSELMRADGLFGAFIVYQSGLKEGHHKRGVYDYEDDSVMLIGDWYHRSANEVQKSYDTWTNWGMEPAPDSFLINGHGSFNCSKDLHLTADMCKSAAMPVLRPRSPISRVRIINVGAMSGFSIRIPGDRITVLTVDGGNLVERESGSFSQVGVLHPGERIDLVIDWGNSLSQDEDQDYFEVILDREYYKKKNLALTPEQRFPIKIDGSSRTKEDIPSSLEETDHTYDLSTAHGMILPPTILGNERPDQVILLYTRIELLAHLQNSPKGYINHTYWIPQDTPLIELPREKWDEHQLVPSVQRQSGKAPWVDIVINNVDEKGHPFHLHGYDFYLISYFRPKQPFGWHAHNPYDQTVMPEGGKYNLISPLKKDTVYVPAAGYVVLRIRADNPGLWMLHCHIIWHHGVGMSMALDVQ